MNKYKNMTMVRECDDAAKYGNIKVSTNGYQGGDSGHGGKMTIEYSAPDMFDISFNGDKSLQIECGGDLEMETLKKIAELIIESLEYKNIINNFENIKSNLKI